MAVNRPANFDGFIGQQKVCRNLKVSIKAAQRREETLDHCLFAGPAGLGKTTLCNIIINAMGGNLFITNGGVLKSPRDLIGSLVRLEEGDFLFIDEIHRIPMAVEEYLYTAMEDFAVDSIASNGAAIRIDLNPFTLLGATTREGMLSEPLLHRFGIVCRLQMYSPDDLYKIINNASDNYKVKITHNAAMYISERCRGTPRIALRTLKRVRDFSVDMIDLDVAQTALENLGIYSEGLTDKDISVLRALADSDRAMGISTLAMIVHDEQDTIENVIEPHLMRCKFIERTSVGRVITTKGKKFLQEV